jgi:hypothetical protein
MKKSVEVSRNKIKELVAKAMKDEPEWWKELLKEKKLTIDDIVEVVMVRAEANLITSYINPYIFELLYDSDLIEEAQKLKSSKGK